MNKKLLLAAIGSAIAGAVAMPVSADVKVGGMAQVELAREQIKSSAGVTTFKGDTVEDNSRGRFWITADEDLGNGMKGLAHFEFRVDTTGECDLEAGGSTCTSGTVTGTTVSNNSANIREKYVGLQTGMGTIKLGSVRSPYKYAGGVLWDAFVTTNLEARGNGGMSPGVFGHNNFMDNAINYTTPTLGGLVLSATYSPDDQTGPGSTTTAGDSAAALEWKGAGLHAIGAWSRNNAGANDVEQKKLGIRGDFGTMSVMVQAENAKNDAGTLDTDTAFLGLQAKFGQVTGAAQLGRTKPTGSATTDYVAVGAFYNFSKTFSTFGGYRTTETDAAKAQVITIGMRKIF